MVAVLSGGPSNHADATGSPNMYVHTYRACSRPANGAGSVPYHARRASPYPDLHVAPKCRTGRSNGRKHSGWPAGSVGGPNIAVDAPP
jgi:hypothetical protein